jgi:imidazole glycerol-phosphate synthase subunit HisH
MISIVNYGVGNLGSIVNMFKKIGVEAKLTQSVEDIENAKKLLLPGVGAFDYGMEMLNKSGYVATLNKKVLEQKTPLLGICLGMQLMTKRSDEGLLPGLGWFDAETVKFNVDTSVYKVPHMGWNNVYSIKENLLLKDIETDPRFYFVHTYHLKCKDAADELMYATYGYDFCCGLQKNNIYGAQFHPEKSHSFGMKLLYNFAHFCN